jgi:uncharacterized protein
LKLRELQLEFGRALRSNDGTPPSSDGDPDFVERFGAYRNNAWQFFAGALEQTYPVLQRRVGPEFFRQLAREYRESHPSRRGDLHWTGIDFPAWLVPRLAGTGYEWLADLARLEWAVADAIVAAQRPALQVAGLGAFAPEALDELRLGLQPSLRCVASPFPVWTVWRANQSDGTAGPIDLAQGAECCVVACTGDRPAVYRLDDVEYRLLQRLQLGDTLAAALAAAATEPDVLARVLAWAFGEQLVVDIVSPSARA